MNTPRELIISIVPDHFGDIVVEAATRGGARGGTVLRGRGTAPNAILQMLGFGISGKEVVYTIVERAAAPSVKGAIVGAAVGRQHFGVMFSLDVAAFARAGEPASPSSSSADTETPTMNDTTNYLMINVIVNKDYAEEAMAAARKAGAGGGTILNARGTAREGDATFFGVQIVPEKELLVILVGKDKADAVLEAIRSLPCLAQKGSGIVYGIPVRDFAVLGKAK